MTLASGTKLGPYEIQAPLGAGGMGEVYRARDPRLGREAAIKVLPASLSADPGRLQRFEQEARSASALNHPNILVVYDVGTNDGAPYLVTELLEGETLRERLRDGTLPPRKALEYAIQLGQGLAAAHEKGIIHRDLKPDNIFLCRDGRCKILDFGLAKLVAREPQDATITRLKSPYTEEGVVMGTASYMSPEQVRGQKADPRSDIFAFGAVLYEMLSGRRAFAGLTAADTASAILKEDPADLVAGNRKITPALDGIVRHCLEKNPEERFQSARDLAFHLRSLSSISESGAASPADLPTRRGPRPIRWLLACLALAMVAAGSWWLGRNFAGKTAAKAAHFQRLTDFAGMEEFPAVSPDGKSVAFTRDSGGFRQLWVRLLSGGVPIQVTRDPVDHQSPRWSPDSGSLIYYSPPVAEAYGTVWQIAALGGTPRPLTHSLGSADLSHDGKRLTFFRFENRQVELVVSALDGNSPQVVTRLSAQYSYSYPRWSPDDTRIAYQRSQVFRSDIFVAPSQGGQPRPITDEAVMMGGFAWLPDGSGIVYSSARGSTILYLATHNLWLAKLSGSAPVQLTLGEESYVSPDISSTGAITASRVHMKFDLWSFPVDGTATENVRRAIQLTRQTGQVQTPDTGPGDRELVFLSDSGGHGNLWIMRQDGTAAARQVTFDRDPGVSLGVPVWSPDGKDIAYVTTRNQKGWRFSLWLVRPDGSNDHMVAENGGWACWTADSKWLYYAVPTDVSYRIEKISRNGGPPVVVRTDNAIGPAMSPDNSTLYYSSPQENLTGVTDYEVRVAHPDNGPARLLAKIPGLRVPVAHGWTVHPVVSPDGKSLALLLRDDSGNINIWTLPTQGGNLRQITDFGQRRTIIARRVSWSSDSRSIFAALAEGDSDIVLMEGVLP